MNEKSALMKAIFENSTLS